jgi:YwqJ-like deaminase
VGRFISVDPMGFGAGDTNLYRYVGNNSTNATDPSGMWINFAIGAAIGGVLDLGLQLWEQKGDFSKIDPTRLAISTVTGALGGGIGGLLAKQGVGLAARTAITAGAEFNLGYWGKVTENKITGKTDVFDGALLSGAVGGVSGAGGELLQAGAGAAWGKAAAGAKNLDQWGGSALDWMKNPVVRGQEFAGIPGGTKWGVNAWDSNANPLSQQFMAMSGNLNIWRQQNIWPELPTSSLKYPNITAKDLGVSLRELDLNNGQVYEQAYALGLKTKAVYDRIKSKNMRSVLAGVSYVDTASNINITKFAQNDEKYLNSFIHDVFQDRVSNYQSLAPKSGISERNLLGQGIHGTHAEVIAASKILRRIEMMNPGLKITSENVDEYLSKMMVYNIGLKGAGSSPGKSMARCANCQVVTADIRSLSDVHPESLQRNFGNFGL